MKQSTLNVLKKQTLITGKSLALAFIIFFTFANILFSQRVSPLYFQLAKEDKAATADFLNKIKELPIFNSFFNINKNIYGTSIEYDVFAEDNRRKQLIAEYESLLEKNPKSRDLLFSLYLLHKADGNSNTADNYLRQAKVVDPSIE